MCFWWEWGVGGVLIKRTHGTPEIQKLKILRLLKKKEQLKEAANFFT